MSVDPFASCPPFTTKRIGFSLVPSEGSRCRTTVNITNIGRFIVPGA